MKVILEDCDNHPSCPHGPCLIFERVSSTGKNTGRRFYACSACRQRSECKFFQWVDEKISKTRTECWKLQNEKAKPRFSSSECDRRLILFKNQPINKRKYCKTCSVIVLADELQHHKRHSMCSNIDKELQTPSLMFHPLRTNEAEAQYFFTEETTSFIVQLLQNLQFTKLILIGAPKIHEYVTKEKIPLQTFLMDIDSRYMQFLDSKHFCHYNLFNNHFFGGDESKKVLEEFLSEKDGEKVALILDPPFGGLIEPISFTLKTLSKWWKSKNSKSDCDEIPLLWCFPYFFEKKIEVHMPHLNMMDYKVTYMNHRKYKEKENKNDSPVRIFTNISPHSFTLPDDGKYKFCSSCDRFVSSENEHCKLCNACTTKHGKTYKHCDLCKKCVKSSYEHCETCNKCSFTNHDCDKVSKDNTCFLCSSVGHFKRDCPQNETNVEKPKKRKSNTGVKEKKLSKRKKVTRD